MKSNHITYLIISFIILLLYKSPIARVIGLGLWVATLILYIGIEKKEKEEADLSMSHNE